VAGGRGWSTRAAPRYAGAMFVAGVGLSQAADSLQAVSAALDQALTPFAGEAPAALLCFITVDRAPALAAVREALIAGSGCACVVGCTGSGVIAGQRELEVESAIVVAALGGAGVRATPFHDPHFFDDNRASGHRAATAVEAGMGDNPLLLAFLDPFSMEGTEFLAGVAELAGRLPVVGGAAADDGAHGATYQIGPAGVSSRGACGLLLSGVVRHQVYLSQACHPLMAPEMVTPTCPSPASSPTPSSARWSRPTACTTTPASSPCSGEDAELRAPGVGAAIPSYQLPTEKLPMLR